MSVFDLIRSSDIDTPLTDYEWSLNQMGHALIGMWAVLALTDAGADLWWSMAVPVALWVGLETFQRLTGLTRRGARNVDMAVDLSFEISGVGVGALHVAGLPVLFLIASALVCVGVVVGVALRRLTAATP